jgi:hypothetical protein
MEKRQKTSQYVGIATVVGVALTQQMPGPQRVYRS